ncbi:class I SAM-dependent methyltransferase [Spirochaeta isovalerica]|uniref:SAM-dependent methyltransferase n=1 Tax=Spirochaeta isovalerica TaxID=150 RepID=A0A841RJB9_9SPIO|nr:class I SAM-dependent methyltransferase [Spirochaeta isovalerica]MBB6482392.1 SAM-dependent methyltransferase [Spirochaeta isovalerica]
MKKLDIIRNYYEPKLREDLPDFRTLGWESREAQFDRFRILTENVELNGHRILDVGCGLGNLLEHLKAIHETPDYTGVDILEHMVERARAKYPEYNFLHLDIFAENSFAEGDFHTIYSSGIFNINMGNNHDFLKDAIKLFLALAEKYVVFNLLHHNSPDRDETYYYFHPEEVVKMIEDINNNKLKSIKIIEHYLQNDFTVILEKK